MLYRVHQKLLVNSTDGTMIGGSPDCVHALPMLGKDKIAVLLRIGAISEVQAPPLSVFTNWAGRARKLDELGIDTIGFIQMDAHDIAYSIRASVRRETESQEDFNRKVDKLALAVARWQGEIRQYLGIGSVNESRR